MRFHYTQTGHIPADEHLVPSPRPTMVTRTHSPFKIKTLELMTINVYM